MNGGDTSAAPAAAGTDRAGFARFSALITALGGSSGTLERVALLRGYLSEASDADRAWTLGLFTGRRVRRMLKTSLLASWLEEWEGIPAWLFEECYHQVGDLAETLSLLTRDAGGAGPTGDLSDQMRRLKQLETADEAEKKAFIREAWASMDRGQRFVFNKLITGGFRVGVSAQTVIQALSQLLDVEAAVLTHRISGKWDPSAISFHSLVTGQGAEDDRSKPYPFQLAHALETGTDLDGGHRDWHAEWKWDGIRGQLIRRKGESFIWSRGEELITDRFPELSDPMALLPDGTVLDGELLALSEGRPLPFSVLQTRIGRSKVTARQLRDAPVHFIAFDLLEYGGRDIRELPFEERRRLLGGIVGGRGTPRIALSEGLPFENLSSLAAIRATARENGAEGLMLKRKDAPYRTGRKRGDWWKWKVEPMSVDAVLVYAQKGHGRRSNLYTDYTFAVRDGEGLVVFAKAYSGLTDRELQEVDRFVKQHGLERFGPVRTVPPELVFEIAFEGISESRRHKSGVAVRFPRILRWRRDKRPEDIDGIEDLRALLNHRP